MRGTMAAASVLLALTSACADDTESTGTGVHRCDPSVVESFESATAEAIDAWAADGGSGVALIATRGCIALLRAIGSADVDVDMTADMVFDIGSLTKEFTAYAILTLADDGKLSLDDTLADWFPGVPADKRDITLRQLLTHTSGLVDIADDDGVPLAYTPELDFEQLSRAELLRRTLRADLVADPGESFSYSNFGYSLLAAIIEAASSEPYATFIAANVLRPFGLERTGYPPDLDLRATELAVGFTGKARWGTTYERLRSDGPGWMLLGSGGMLAPASDLFLWIDGLASGAARGDPVAALFLDLFHETTPSGERYIVSFGSNDIYEAGYLWMIDREVTVIALTNNSDFTADGLVNRLWKAIRAGGLGS